MMVFVEHMAPRRSGIRSNAAMTDVPIKYRAEEFASRITHGATRKRKLCSHDGCTNQAKNAWRQEEAM